MLDSLLAFFKFKRNVVNWCIPQRSKVRSLDLPRSGTRRAYFFSGSVAMLAQDIVFLSAAILANRFHSLGAVAIATRRPTITIARQTCVVFAREPALLDEHAPSALADRTVTRAILTGRTQDTRLPNRVTTWADATGAFVFPPTVAIRTGDKKGRSLARTRSHVLVSVGPN